MVGFSWLLIFIVFGLDDLCIVWWLVVDLLAGFCFISLFVGFRGFAGGWGCRLVYCG